MPVSTWISTPHLAHYCSFPRLYMSIESHSEIILTGENQVTWRKTCPSATLSTTNPTWTEPGSNPGLCDERLVTNSLRHGTAPPQQRDNSCQIVKKTLSGLFTNG
jgi:hypothetical protein